MSKLFQVYILQTMSDDIVFHVLKINIVHSLKAKKGTDKHTGKTSKETSDFRTKFFSSVHS